MKDVELYLLVNMVEKVTKIRDEVLQDGGKDCQEIVARLDTIAKRMYMLITDI